jgi:hypothetical protein
VGKTTDRLFSNLTLNDRTIRSRKAGDINVKALFKSHRAGKHSRAQGMVEFALALPIFLLLMFGIIEFARLLVTYSAVYTASREAVRYGVATGMSVNGIPHYQDCAEIRNAGMNLGRIGGVQLNDFDIRYDRGLVEIPDEWTSLQQCSGSASSVTLVLGDRILVKVETVFEPIVPLVNLPSIPVSSTTARTILSGVNIRGTPLPTSTRINTYTATLTFTPTETGTPTPTFTETPVLTQTSTPTETLVPTLTSEPTETVTGTLPATPTETPTPTGTTTPTPTPTPTNTNTPTVLCTDYTIAFSSRTSSTYVFRLNNTGTLTSIRSIRLTWYDPVKLIRYEGPTGTYWWAGDEGESPSTSPWYLPFNPNTAFIISPSTNPLTFYYDGDFVLEPYIEVALDNNCLIKGGLAPTPTPTPTSTATATSPSP